MRFTPSTTYLQLANGTGKQTDWDVYIKTVDTLSASLTAGSWTSVSNYFIGNIPDIQSQIEFELGQFVSNAVTLEMHTIPYWKSFFLDSYTGYYEAKITLILRDGDDIAQDGITAFSGFIDTNSIVYDEFHDKTSFTIRTLLDMANYLNSEEMVTKYVARNPSSICANSLAFQNIKGLYLDTTRYFDPTVSDLRPKEGIHKVTCGGQLVDSTFMITASFDDGNYTRMENPGSYFIPNSDITQGVLLSHNGFGTFPITAEQEDYFIVLNKEEVLPWQWPNSQNEKQLLEILLPKMGVTQVNFDNLTLSSYDNSRRYSLISNLTDPLTSNNYSTKTLAIAANASNSSIYYGFGNNIYEYSLTAANSNNRTTKIVSLTAGQAVSKLVWNNNWAELWFVFGTSANDFSKSVGLWKRTTGISATTGNINAFWYNFEVMDNDIGMRTGIFADAINNGVWTVSAIPVGNALPLSGHIAFGGGESVINAFACQRNGIYYFFPTTNSTGPTYHFWEIYWDNASSRWVSSGSQANMGEIVSGTKNGTYNSKDGIVYWDQVPSDWSGSHIRANQYTVESVTTVAVYTNYVKAGKLFYDPAYYAPSKTYYTLATKNNVSIASITGKNFTTPPLASATSIESYYDGTSITACGWSSPQSTKDVIYGLDEYGLLFKYSPEIEMFVNKTNFNNMTLFQILQKLLNQYNLVAIFRSDKSVDIYRRSDQGGNPVTTGNTFQINTDKTAQIIQKVKYIPAYDEITVSNNEEDSVYNGVEFSKKELGIIKRLNVSSDLLPTNILKDLAYNLYQFYKNQWDMLNIELAGVTRFEYEPFDNCNVDYSDANVNVNITGDGFPIYNITYMENGNMKLDILI